MIPLGILATTSGGAAGWLNTLTDATQISWLGITASSTGNIYAAGNGNSITLVANYDSFGVIQWQRALNISGSTTSAAGVALDSTGNVYVAGNMNLNQDGTLLKYDSSGTLQWQYRWNTGNGDIFTNLHVDASDNLYVIGTTNNQYTTRCWILKINTSGTSVYKKTYSSGGSSFSPSSGSDLATDSNGNLYFTGSSGSTPAATVVKFDSAGTIQWQRSINAASGSDAGQGLTVDGSDNIYVSVHSNFTGSYQPYLFKYSSAGILQWQKRVTTSFASYASDIASDLDGNIYQLLYATDESISHILKWDSSGSLLWQRSFDGTSTLVLKSISVKEKTIIVSGYFKNSSSINQGITAYLPTDGSKTGVYAVGSNTFTYAASSLTVSDGTLTDAAGSLVVQNETVATRAAGGGTDTTPTFVSTTTQI